MKEYQIMPWKMNMFHYYAFENKKECVAKALGLDQKYMTDLFDNTPLQYALDRNSFQCVEQFLTLAIAKEDFYTEMKPQELIQLINSDPLTLPEFFKKASTISEQDAEKFGMIKNQFFFGRSREERETYAYSF